MAAASESTVAPRGHGVALGTLVAFGATLAALQMAPGRPTSVSLPDQAAALATRLERDVADAVALAGTLRTRIGSGDAIGWKEFDALVGGSALHTRTQTLVAWAPRVAAGDREAFEASSGRDGFRSFRIVAPVRAPDARAVSAPDPNDDHHPIALATPLGRGGDLLGVDVAAAPAFAPAIERLQQTPGAAIVGPTSLLADHGGSPAGKSDGSAGRAAALYVVVGVGDRAARGLIVVALSWPDIARSATVGQTSTAANPDAAFALPVQRSARATFAVQGMPWALELRLPNTKAGTAKPGQAKSGPNPEAWDVWFDRVAQVGQR